jgi:hypothetical protein
MSNIKDEQNVKKVEEWPFEHFSCERKYGKIRQESERSFDLVDELKVGIGYKLMKGHFGDVKDKDDN